MHWATKFIGLPYQSGAQGPDAFDCWAFARHVWADQFKLDVAAIPDVDGTDARATVAAFRDPEHFRNWVKAGKPGEGDAVLMSHSSTPHHVGVWIDADGGGVLHCIKGAGVIFSTASNLLANGWHIVGVYRHVC